MEVQVQSKNKILKRKGTKKKSSIVSEILKDYCSHASLHGIGYLGAKDRTIIEKIWWVLVFIVSLSFCVYLISKTYLKWVNSPVIVSFAKGQTPLWEIPFPAVTICPLNKVHQNIYNYTQNFNKRKTLKGDEKKFFWDVSLVCNLDYYDIHDSDADKTTNEDAIKNILKVASRDYIGLVTWQYNYVNKDDFFSPRLTEEGLCYTSNSFNQNDMFTDKLNHNIPYLTHNQTNCGWNIEKGYPPGLDLNVYPRRTAQDGYISGLSVTLTTYVKQTDYVCGIPIYGYKLILHNPAEMPRAGQKYILIPLNRQVTISIKPELLTTSNGLLNISPKIRNCYFSHEKSLMFFNVYTQINCQMECLANITKAYCGCVSFFVPRDNNTLICGFGHNTCIEDMRELLHHFEMMQREKIIPDDIRETVEYRIYEKCDCLPSCSSLHYTAETSEAKGHFLKSMLASELNNVNDSKIAGDLQNGEVILTQVDMFFKENHIIAVERSELYGQTDFLANCGGLLGLFLGFSLLSIIEIIYFITIRVYFKVKQTKREERVNGND